MEIDKRSIINALKKTRSFSTLWRILLCLYFPIGLILSIVRTFMVLQVYLAYVIFSSHFYIKSIVLRIMTAVLGVIVLEDKSQSNCTISRGILVGNHVSALDFISVHLLTNCLWPISCTVPDGFINCVGLKQIPSYSDVASNEIADSIANYVENSNKLLLVFPEGEINRNSILMKFSYWWVNCNVPTQPIAIRMWRPPFDDIIPAVISSTWYTDIMWTLFSPFSIYIITYLPVLQGKFSNKEAVALQAENIIANELQITVSRTSNLDEKVCEKKTD